MTIALLIVVMLGLLGVALVLVEIFLIPGTTFAGIIGCASLVAGIVYAYQNISSTAGTITLLGSVTILAVLFFLLIRMKTLRRISLNTDINESVDNSELLQIKKGDKGTALSRLNPIGKVLINDSVVEGKTFNGEFIDEKTGIEVVKVQTYNVLVKRIQ